MSLLTGARIIFLGTTFSLTVFGLFCYNLPLCDQERRTMVSVLLADLISCWVALCFVAFTIAPLVSNLTRSLSWKERYGREIASTCQIQLGRLQ